MTPELEGSLSRASLILLIDHEVYSQVLLRFHPWRVSWPGAGAPASLILKAS